MIFFKSSKLYSRISADNPFQINRTPSEPLPKEIIGDFCYKKVMLIGTIDCEIEGKIARRYMMDLMHRKFNRSNSITVNDLKKLRLNQVSIKS
jgi:hypothetical protein